MVRRVSCVYEPYILTPDFSSTVMRSSQMVICLIQRRTSDSSPDNKFDSSIVPMEPSERFTADDDLGEEVIAAIVMFFYYYTLKS